MSSFDRQPTLRGELLVLQPLRPEDFDALFLAASDPLIWEQHPVRDRYTEPVFRQFFAQAVESGGALVARDRATQQVIGTSRFHGYNPQASEIEVGWTFLTRPYWGGRYNGEMKRLMLNHAFQYVEQVLFLIGPNNMRSQRAVGKIGGVQIGTRVDDTGLQSVVFAITRKAFQAAGGS